MRQIDDLAKQLEYELNLTRLDFTTLNRALWRILLRELPRRVGQVQPPTGLKRPSPQDETAVVEFERTLEIYLESLLGS
ncbi:MAG: hypothetical protein AAGG48_07960 [Planctomycetota bacterium]